MQSVKEKGLEKKETSSSNSRLLYTGSEEGSQLEKEPEQISSMRRSPCSIAVKEEEKQKKGISHAMLDCSRVQPIHPCHLRNCACSAAVTLIEKRPVGTAELDRAHYIRSHRQCVAADANVVVENRRANKSNQINTAERLFAHALLGTSAAASIEAGCALATGGDPASERAEASADSIDPSRAANAL